MKKISFVLLMFALLGCADKPVQFTDLNGNGTMEPYENEDLKIDERVDDILSRLTTDDKINVVVGIGFNVPGMFESIQPLRVPGAVGGTYTFDSLGINGLITTDGPAGVRILPIEGSETYYCTAFPIASLISSTWDKDLAYQIGKAMGNEVKEYGMDILLAPALNIHRNPLAGRNFEYFSEDPLLSGKMAASITNGIQSHGVGTSIKHFVANNQETNRNVLDVLVSERALREIYLKGFEIAVKEAKPWTVMSAYNQVNGITVSQNSELLTKVLRDEWGFEGFVMTDWFAGTDAIEQMKAGNDLLMPGRPDQKEALKKGLENGTLSEEVIDQNARRILKTLLISPSFNRYEYSNKPDLEAHAELARKVAAEGAILLKNESVLPIDPANIKVAAFGNGSYDFIAGGTGSGDVVEAYTISLVQGLENAGITIDENLKKVYDNYISDEKAERPKEVSIFFLPPPIEERSLNSKEINGIADSSDIAFITIGRLSGEFQDRRVEGDFNLTDTEMDMIDKVSTIYHQQGKKVVMILNIGNVIETASWQDKVDAILLPWQGGQEAGNAVVDVLIGKVNPSGKLPTSFPNNYEDVSSMKNFPGEEYGEPVTVMGAVKAVPSKVTHEEGIYVGYRYYSTFGREVAYPFGYGMSYTSFEYSSPSLTNDNGIINIKATVKNTGTTSGREVVQVYFKAPGTLLDQPALELRTFDKTSLLEPGQSQEIEFTIQPKDYASYDSERSSWIVEAGEFEVKIGASSTDIRLIDRFTIPEEIVVEKLSHSLRTAVDIVELSSKDK